MTCSEIIKIKFIHLKWREVTSGCVICSGACACICDSFMNCAHLRTSLGCLNNYTLFQIPWNLLTIFVHDVWTMLFIDHPISQQQPEKIGYGILTIIIAKYMIFCIEYMWSTEINSIPIKHSNNNHLHT